jgi:Abnormal spindle-like microcephaly-assoc'd, ASPM-SPD-2-Hydin
MRGTHTPQPRGPLTCSFRLVTLFPLAALWAYAAVLSGCASVAANPDSRIAAKIAVVPETVQFHEVVVGQENSQTLRVTNTSTQAIRLEALRITGKGFSVASGQSPVTLVPGHSALFTVAFTPASAAPVAGALEISGADLGTLSVPLEGSGEKAAAQLQASPSVLNFGTLPVHSAAAQTVTLKNDGNIAISISSVSLPSAAFSISGLSSGTALSPGQTLQFRVTFQPPVAGAALSGITINSSSLSSPVKLSVFGSGSSSSAGSSASGSATTTPPATSPSVKLSWNASANSVVGYHVYRGSASGGPYSRISGSAVTALGYEDATVQAGNRYYYVVSALDASGDESAYSNEAAANVPNQ